jgi:hypothetical protein
MYVKLGEINLMLVTMICTPFLFLTGYVRYINDVYNAAQNIQIPTTPSMISKLYFTCLIFYFILYLNIIY